jgi:hypothetical protein
MSNRFDPAGARRPAWLRLQGAAAAVAAGVLVTSGAALASALASGASNAIHGCVRDSSRALTVPKAGAKCPAGTTAISWNVSGPAGKTGPKGKAGQQGAPGWGNVYGGGSYGFDAPHALAYDGTRVWVANAGGDSVTEVDASSGGLVRTLSGGSYGFDEPLALAYDGTRIWVANDGSNSVTELPGG